MAAMTLCVGCSSAKDSSKDTTKATTETKMKVQSKYKVPKITAAKKTDQLADAQKGEEKVTVGFHEGKRILMPEKIGVSAIAMPESEYGKN